MCEEATSPTAASEAIITTGVIDAKQKNICDDVRHTKCVDENRDRIGRRQDYHEDKRKISQYISLNLSRSLQ